jgi:DNA polymerase
VNLKDIYDAYEVDASFAHLRKYYNFVPGVGAENADILFVGEAPGAQENKHREPFIGESGQFLNKKLERIGLKREEVYLTNVLKYRPDAKNRDPSVPEIQASLIYLGHEISVIKPKLIVAMGKIPAKAFMPGKPWQYIRGNIIPFKGTKLLITYHPAYIKHYPAVGDAFDRHFDLIKGEILETMS